MVKYSNLHLQVKFFTKKVVQFFSIYTPHTIAISSLVVAIFSFIIAHDTLLISQQIYRYKSHDDYVSIANVLTPKPSEKLVPRNILDYIYIGSSVEYAKTILGPPLKVHYTKDNLYFNKSEWNNALKAENGSGQQYKVLVYAFKNVLMKIATDDGEVISAIAIGRGDEDNPIDIPTLKDVSLGKTTIRKILSLCGDRLAAEDVYHEFYFAQCFWGREGHFYFYSFGYDNPVGYHPETGEFDGKHANGQKVDCITISDTPNIALRISKKYMENLKVGNY